MSDANPKHGEIVTVKYPPRTLRRRWCGYCATWTWENDTGVFRHSRGGAAYCRHQRRLAMTAKP